MIISLEIHDFVLIDKSTTHFTAGLNVLTGETGSGKSAVIDSLTLVLGARADTSLIRNGQEKAHVSAMFDVSAIPAIPSLLESMGFSVDLEQLHIKREITKDGKSRIWINREMAPLSSLKALSPYLMEFVGQRANRELMEAENHLDVLDTIGGLTSLREQFKGAHLQHLKKERELQNLIQNREASVRRKEKLSLELKEIEEIQPQPGEEEALFEEYCLLANVEELKEGLLSISNILNGEGVLQALSLVRKKTEDFLKIDQSLQDCLDMTKEAIADMKEVERFIDSRLSSLEASPERLSFLDDRLKSFNRLKKLYGGSMDAVIAKWEELKQESMNLENEDEQGEALRKEIAHFKVEADALAKELKDKRSTFSESFSRKVTSVLKTLNMKNAVFTVSLTKKARTEKGDDFVEFFLTPNLGENPVSVSKSASGGELSRVLLAIKLQEEHLSSIVFDEIDANIGGNTAVLVGEKLKELSLKKQVILITHFPQVARFACRHIKISKKETGGRTFTEIETLEESGREEELLRMLGGSNFF